MFAYEVSYNSDLGQCRLGSRQRIVPAVDGWGRVRFERGRIGSRGRHCGVPASWGREDRGAPRGGRAACADAPRHLRRAGGVADGGGCQRDRRPQRAAARARGRRRGQGRHLLCDRERSSTARPRVGCRGRLQPPLRRAPGEVQEGLRRGLGSVPQERGRDHGQQVHDRLDADVAVARGGMSRAGRLLLGIAALAADAAGSRPGPLDAAAGGLGVARLPLDGRHRPARGVSGLGATRAVSIICSDASRIGASRFTGSGRRRRAHHSTAGAATSTSTRSTLPTGLVGGGRTASWPTRARASSVTASIRTLRIRAIPRVRDLRGTASDTGSRSSAPE